jgi:hypothetical protein
LQACSNGVALARGWSTEHWHWTSNLPAFATPRVLIQIKGKCRCLSTVHKSSHNSSVCIWEEAYDASVLYADRTAPACSLMARTETFWMALQTAYPFFAGIPWRC